MLNRSLIIIESIDEARYFVKNISEKGFQACVALSLNPNIRAYLGQNNIISVSSSDIIGADTYEQIMEKEAHLEKELTPAVPFEEKSRPEEYYVNAYYHYLRLIWRHFLWNIAIIDSCITKGGYKRVLAFKYPAIVTGSPWIEDDQLYMGLLAEQYCNKHGIEFLALPSQTKPICRQDLRLNAAPLDVLFSRINLLFLQSAAVLLSKKTKLLVSNFKYNVDKICESLIKDDNGLKIGRYTLGNKGWREILFSFGLLVYSLIGKNISRRFSSYPIDYMIPIATFSRALSASYDSRKAKTFLEMSLMSLRRPVSTTYKNVYFGEIIRQKAADDLVPYMLDLHFQAFGLEKGMEHFRPSLVLSQMNFELNGALGGISAKLGIPSILISHGSHVIQEDKHAAREHEILAKNILAGGYRYSAVQSPLAEAMALNLLKDPRRIVRIKPTLWGRKINKSRLSDVLTILHAGTFKLRHNRRYIYETADEYLKALVDICTIVSGRENLKLIVKMRTDNYELPAKILNQYLPKSKNIILEADRPLNQILSEAQLLISFSSTAIEEALSNEIPVLLYGGGGRYAHIPCEPYSQDQEINRAVTFIKNVSELENYLARLNDNHRSFEVSPDKFAGYRFADDDVIDFGRWSLGLAGGRVTK